MGRQLGSSDGVLKTERSRRTTNDRAGLLVIRAWVEPGSSEPLRARVRMCTDVSTGVERTVMLARADMVGATVQEWLADILGEQTCRPDR